jgi:hypothetical protein
MPIAFRLDSEADLVVAECSGTFGPIEAKEGARAFWERSEWSGKPIVWDLRTARFDSRAGEVRKLAEFVLEHQPAVPAPKVAFVTTREVDFGFARMFEMYREHPATETQIFRDFDEAVTWARSARARAE